MNQGSGRGARCGEGVLPERAARGTEARATDLPGPGADRTPPAARRVPEMVAKLIFLCNVLSVSGGSRSEMRKVWQKRPLPRAGRRGADGASLSVDSAWLPRHVCHDPGAEAVARAKARPCPQPRAPRGSPPDPTDTGQAPDTPDILVAADRAIPTGWQRRMAAGLPPSRVRGLPAGHAPFLPIPGPLADRIAAIPGG